ncbi:CoA-transferase family III protein [Bordetella pertussis H918]|uniref:CoA-transferase family III protein n=1 Tax=Bordetella pertussis CHLA-26 TaxID=1331284 RepID=A0AAI9J1S1_BORPT|nr:CoA-transferase family III protein [Bordetella pertussis CHLA-11]ETH00876.1 CoA-transferase family III protein [Bordetella pertussis 2250905]ETH04924.1 CoA-transferase family III protein [Bordetella pertussis 2356847]ETH07448.1 CoA-transferase family III protein [Bordetella pertussis 2371640]ETH19671.1 CoA-transferase family III protein [Bordetella pertussis CHLA-13]ETH23103.1 CoA-transferase family III protein [Bordetella pertussis CHLA-15]ETH27819.1 CoA-transferase family III protein [Bo
MPPTPLGGVRVLDLSKVLAGPLCTQYMADMGADVIKVEAAGQGDDTRGWPPFQDGQAAVFLSCNRNKRSIALDLKSAHGRAVVQRLAAWADVVVHSFGPGVAQKLGVDWEALSEINPRLVYCAISGFGPVGSLSHGKGFDVVLQAFCGMISITGETEGGAVRSPFSPVDQATGLHALIGILAALRQRDASGRGVTVDASLFDTALGFMGYFMQGYWARGTEPARAGAGHESLCPYQDFATADKPIILGIANDALWRAFCALAERPELASDPRFATNAQRVANRAQTLAATRALLAARTRGEWLPALEQAGIPCSPIHTLVEVDAHPHTRESGMVFDYPETGTDAGPLKGVAQPVRFDGMRLTTPKRPPSLNQDWASVLADAGYSDPEVRDLLQQMA